ncbi:MAG: hypothetical protein H3C54_00745 [Taibaiella sp.]|nr:hypothetical protein [Taibaiella sp.]
MKHRYLAPIVFCLLIASCKKKENTPVTTPKPKVQVQTDYRLTRVYDDSSTLRTYSYNEDNLVQSVTNFHYVMAFHYTRPDTNFSYSFYEYDDQRQVAKTAGMPVAQAKEYSYFTYNSRLKPEARYRSDYMHALEHYTYDGDKLVERKYYDLKGQLYFTENWTYNNDGNAKMYTRVYASAAFGKTEIIYHQYDNGQALRLAMPGIHDIQIMGDFASPVMSVSANNAIKYEQTNYAANGSSSTQLTEVAYQYNSGGFPSQMTTSITKNGATITNGPVYFEYNK